MTVPTPEALADAWLARLPAAQIAAAQAHTDVRLAAWFGGLALLLAGCAFATRIRALPRITASIEAQKPRPWLTATAAAGALTLFLAGLKGVFDAAAGWWGDAVLTAGGGVPPGAGFATRLQAAIAGAATVTLAAIVFVPIVVWLMRRLPRAWPFVFGAAATGVVLTLGWLPYALALGPALGPLPPGPLRSGLAQLIATAQLPARDILIDPDPASITDVTGGLAPPRVVIGSDALGDTPAQARAYVAHVIGHYAHADILIVSLIISATLFFGALAAQRFSVQLARLFGAQGVRSPSETAALPALAAIAIVAVAASTIAGAGYLRWANVRADAYSLQMAREPDGLAEALVRDWDHAAVAPNPVEEAILYSHPPLRSRLVHAMTWKVRRGG